MVAAAAAAAASVSVFVAVAAAWAAVAAAECAAADSSSLQDRLLCYYWQILYNGQLSVSDIWVDVIASTGLGCVVQPQLFIFTLPNSSSWHSNNKYS